MNSYIATFYSHFGAMSYFKALKKQGVKAKPMPVPRKISSSCGTCIQYVHTVPVFLSDLELEHIYIETTQGFQPCPSRQFFE